MGFPVGLSVGLKVVVGAYVGVGLPVCKQYSRSNGVSDRITTGERGWSMLTSMKEILTGDGVGFFVGGPIGLELNGIILLRCRVQRSLEIPLH